MKTPKFEENKLRRLIRTQGICYRFYRPELDKFKEPTGHTWANELKGVFHQTTQHISVYTVEGGSIQTKQVPMILAPFAEARNLQQDDLVDINGRCYKVTGLLDIGNWNIAIDISLEEVLDGTIL